MKTIVVILLALLAYAGNCFASGEVLLQGELKSADDKPIVGAVVELDKLPGKPVRIVLKREVAK